ncbi:mucin-5AC-like isoform X1 [Aphis craccivora]|uniref:Mucin-5AC-like isoform X1 n=1 Tax=Aphis craccivora TaxID=307492 RepID=A0A6G0ZRD0_APHCR|nr:mucin-5AC-like isoform X1 [Aphis craccivora]
MAGSKIFITVLLTLVATDSVFSCSLRSHKHGSSHPCLSSTSESTSTLHLTPVLKPHTISPPCDSSANPSSCSSTVHAPAISSTPTLSPDSLGSTPLISPTPLALTNNTDILNSIIQILSSPAYSLHAGKAPTFDKSTLPSSSTSNAAQLPASDSKPHTTSSPCASGSSSSSSSILPNPSCDSIQSITVPIPKSSYETDTVTNTDIINFLLNKSSVVSPHSSLSNSKPTPLLPPCLLFKPTLNKDVVPGTKPCAISHHAAPSLSVLPGVPSGSTPPHPVHEVLPLPVSEKPPASFLEHGSETAPEEFPAESNLPVSQPEVTPTNTEVDQSLFSGYNPIFINLLLTLLLSNKAQTGSSPLIPTQTHDVHTSNVTPVPDPDKKPHTISPACSSSSSESTKSSCLSNVLNNQSNSTISPLQQILTSLTPPPDSGISSGFNPEFIKLVIKNLLSNRTSTSIPFSSLIPLLRAKLNTTSIVSSTPNPIPMSTVNRPLSELNSNVSSNNTFDSAPASDNNQNILISKNQELNNFLIKLFTSYNASKTSISPCSPSSTSYPSSTLNTTQISPVPCIPLVKTLPGTLSKFPSLKSSSKPYFPSLIQSPIITPLSNVKSFPERVQHLAPIPIPYPTSPSSNIDLCRSKHKDLQLSSLPSTGVNPCLPNVVRPHTPHLPLPCSLSSTKLSSGCKNIYHPLSN